MWLCGYVAGFENRPEPGPPTPLPPPYMECKTLGGNLVVPWPVPGTLGFRGQHGHGQKKARVASGAVIRSLGGLCAAGLQKESHVDYSRAPGRWYVCPVCRGAATEEALLAAPAAGLYI